MVCEKSFFWVMASQNIPSQSCTHLLRILLVMLVVIKEVCDGGGEQGGLRFAALSKDFSTSLNVGLLQHSKSGVLSDHPSSSSASYAGQPQASKLLFLCFL